MNVASLYGKKISLPVGNLLLLGTSQELVGVQWEHMSSLDQTYESNSLIEAAEKQLREYFACKRTHFDLPVIFEGTSFQKAVWNALQNIPFGTTVSYTSIAQITGNALAVRAVASAVAKNPLPIVVPCHRVIGRDGKLRGFAGGLPNKKILLDLESDSF